MFFLVRCVLWNLWGGGNTAKYGSQSGRSFLDICLWIVVQYGVPVDYDCSGIYKRYDKIWHELSRFFSFLADSYGKEKEGSRGVHSVAYK